MKKNILLLSSVGIGAGLLYALGLKRQKQKKTNTSEAEEPAKAEESFAGEAAPVSHIRESGSADLSQGGASMARIDNGHAILSESEPQIDDRGTDQHEASEILRTVRDNAFEASDEKLALALGRPTEEIAEWTSGAGLIDGDVVMKARTLAIQRGLSVE